MKPAKQPIPAFKEGDSLGWVRCVEGINAVPSLNRREPTEIVVRADVVVPMSEGLQRLIERSPAAELKLSQIRLERAEETLNAPVLPRAVQVNVNAPSCLSPLSWN